LQNSIFSRSIEPEALKKLSLETVRPTAKISEKSAADFPPDKVFR
jgi:hypothetical protein